MLEVYPLPHQSCASRGAGRLSAGVGEEVGKIRLLKSPAHSGLLCCFCYDCGDGKEEESGRRELPRKTFSVVGSAWGS